MHQSKEMLEIQRRMGVGGAGRIVGCNGIVASHPSLPTTVGTSLPRGPFFSGCVHDQWHLSLSFSLVALFMSLPSPSTWNHFLSGRGLSIKHASTEWHQLTVEQKHAYERPSRDVVVVDTPDPSPPHPQPHDTVRRQRMQALQRANEVSEVVAQQKQQALRRANQEAAAREASQRVQDALCWRRAETMQTEARSVVSQGDGPPRPSRVRVQAWTA
jgi:hypothetical protein